MRYGQKLNNYHLIFIQPCVIIEYYYDIRLNMKTCKKCLKLLDEDQFNKDSSKKDGLDIYCRECMKIKSKLSYLKNKEKHLAKNKIRYEKNKESILIGNKKYYQDLKSSSPETLMLRSAKRRAKVQNLPFDINIEDIIIPEHCPILHIKLETSSNHATANSPSLDKIIPELGYTKGNIQVISNLANTMKWDASFQNLVDFAEWVNKEIKPLLKETNETSNRI